MPPMWHSGADLRAAGGGPSGCPVPIIDSFNLARYPYGMSSLDHHATEHGLGGAFTFPGTSLPVRRMGYGAMQLAGKGVFGPPKDPDAAVAV